MGGFANSVFRIMLGWMQSVAADIWSGVTGKGDANLLVWISRNWLLLFVILCVAGAVIDLAVYLLRWKPIEVWKSYFRRKRNRNSVSQNRTEEIPETVYGGDLPTAEKSIRPECGYPERQRIALNEKANPGTGHEPAAVKQSASELPRQTNAGKEIRTENDSPLREPADPERFPVPRETTRQSFEKAIRPRRRRITVTDLFSDPEDDLARYEKPKPVIDQKEAYHSPVYPRSWKEGEDSAP